MISYSYIETLFILISNLLTFLHNHFNNKISDLHLPSLHLSPLLSSFPHSRFFPFSRTVFSNVEGAIGSSHSKQDCPSRSQTHRSQWLRELPYPAWYRTLPGTVSSSVTVLFPCPDNLRRCCEGHRILHGNWGWVELETKDQRSIQNARDANLRLRAGFDLIPPEGKDYDYKRWREKRLTSDDVIDSVLPIFLSISRQWEIFLGQDLMYWRNTKKKRSEWTDREKEGGMKWLDQCTPSPSNQ